MKIFSSSKLKEYNRSVSSKKTFQIIYYLCLLGIFSCLLLIFFIKAFITKPTTTLSYKEVSSTDYNVKLKPNEYYEVDRLPSGMDYIASLIDSININFNYTFTTNKDIDYDATYYIEAITRVYGKDDKNTILYEKKENIVDEQKISKKDIMANNFVKEISLNYDRFNNFVKSFKTSYGLNSVSDVTIVLHIKTHGVNDEFSDSIDLDSIALVVIPLTEQTINITIDSKNINNSSSIIDNSIWKNVNPIYLMIVILFSVADIYVIVCLIKIFIRAIKSRSKYDRTLNKILKDYDSIIVNVENSVDEENYEIINVSSFEELRDLHDNLGIPILFNNITPNKLSYFTVINDNLLYKYTLDATHFSKVVGGKNEK